MNRKLVIIVLLLLVPTCVGILSGIIYAVQATGQIVRDAYASDWTTEFVIAHLRANDNRWPTGWHDLKDEFDTLAAPQQYAWTFIELKDRVWPERGFLGIDSEWLVLNSIELVLSMNSRLFEIDLPVWTG